MKGYKSSFLDFSVLFPSLFLDASSIEYVHHCTTTRTTTTKPWGVFPVCFIAFSLYFHLLFFWLEFFLYSTAALLAWTKFFSTWDCRHVLSGLDAKHFYKPENSLTNWHLKSIIISLRMNKNFHMLQNQRIHLCVHYMLCAYTCLLPYVWRGRLWTRGHPPSPSSWIQRLYNNFYPPQSSLFLEISPTQFSHSFHGNLTLWLPEEESEQLF